MSYAWIIDRDHLFGPGGEFSKDDDASTYDATGVMGPSAAPDELLERLKAGEGLKFRMYDDDGELYFTGRAIGVGEDAPDGEGVTEEFAYGPLGDFGAGNSGCTRITWDGHPDWEIG